MPEWMEHVVVFLAGVGALLWPLHAAGGVIERTGR